MLPPTSHANLYAVLVAAALHAAPGFAQSGSAEVVPPKSDPIQQNQQETDEAEAATEPDSPKALTIADYPGWSRVTSVELAPGGRHLTYAYRANDSTSWLFIANANGEVIHEAENGRRPQFSEKGRYVGYIVSPTAEEARRLRKK